MDVSKAIRDLRLKLGWSQQKFATEIGVALTTISRCERGVSKPLPIILEKIKQLAREKGLGFPEE